MTIDIQKTSKNLIQTGTYKVLVSGDNKEAPGEWILGTPVSDSFQRYIIVINETSLGLARQELDNNGVLTTTLQSVPISVLLHVEYNIPEKEVEK